MNTLPMECGNCNLYGKTNCPRETSERKQAKNWNTWKSAPCPDYDENNKFRLIHDQQEAKRVDDLQRMLKNDTEIIESLFRGF